ncbi:MAG: hypothetical protein ABIR55_16130 [Burkholderiaceae bacterium]
MDLAKRVFKGPADADGPGSEPTMFAPGVPAHDFAAQLPTRRELLRVRTRNTLRLSGIPESWIEPQVLLEPDGGRTFLHLRLVVRQWDHRLLRYAFAFQTQLMREIERIDPQAREWLLSIVWQFPHDLACPDPELPQPSAWLDIPPSQAEPDDLQDDLAQFLAVRDAEMARSQTTDDLRGS